MEAAKYILVNYKCCRAKVNNNGYSFTYKSYYNIRLQMRDGEFLILYTCLYKIIYV